MRVHIVDRYNSYAMKRCIAPLLHLSCEVTVGEDIDESADLNYHVPFHYLAEYQPTGQSKHVVFYTHTNKGMEAVTLEACRKADAVVAMGSTGRDELISMGVEREKIVPILAGSGNIPGRRRNIAVIGSVQPNGRKREWLPVELIWALPPKISQMIHFVFVGHGWGPVVEQLGNLGASAEFLENVSDEELSQIYRSIDYLLVTSHVEGGPITILEAMSAGVPVISPLGMGYARFADIGYSSVEQLAALLTRDLQPAVARMEAGRTVSWRWWAENHALLFGRLAGEEVGIAENDGLSRYRQLLEVIAEAHPEKIVEIGTWNGVRAYQMIAEAGRYRGHVSYYGYDLFDEMTPALLESELSKLPPSLDAVRTLLADAPARIELKQGNTRKTLQGFFTEADLYFIDGGHAEETIRSDWWHIAHTVGKEAVVVFDDYYTPEIDGFGCNRIVEGLGPEWQVEILPAVTRTERMEIQMVKVRRA